MRGVWAMSMGLMVALGCGDDTSTRVDGGAEVDATGDAADVGAGDADQGEVTDTTAPEVDDTSAAETQAPDVGPEVSEDAAQTVDASPSDAAFPGDRTRGQCASSGDCPGTLFCAESAPGGICNGCGAEPCPEGTACNEFGACSRDCAGDDDCPVGMRCHPSQDICALVVCSFDVDCAAPYVCDAGFCRRPTCDIATVCPAGFACVGGVCVEPYWAQ